MIDTAIRASSNRSYSEYELRSILETQYGALPNLDKALDQTILYLKQHNIIHDKRLALHFAHHYAHKGNQFIINRLNLRKINPDCIQEALLSIPKEKTRAWEETQKKLFQTSMHTMALGEKLNSIARFLSGRQFSEEVIHDTLDRLENTNACKLKPVNDSNWNTVSRPKLNISNS